MRSNIIKYAILLFKLIVIATALILICFVYHIGVQWSSTNDEYNKLVYETVTERDIYPAEKIINIVLFDRGHKGNKQPAELLVRDSLNPRRHLDRHAQTFILARRLEDRFSKDELLITYLSNAYFGGGDYGLTTAANSLYGKHVSELSDDEAIALAALIYGPNLRNNPEGWKVRQEMFKAENDLP